MCLPSHSDAVALMLRCGKFTNDNININSNIFFLKLKGEKMCLNKCFVSTQILARSKMFQFLTHRDLVNIEG